MGRPEWIVDVEEGPVFRAAMDVVDLCKEIIGHAPPHMQQELMARVDTMQELIDRTLIIKHQGKAVPLTEQVGETWRERGGLEGGNDA